MFKYSLKNSHIRYLCSCTAQKFAQLHNLCWCTVKKLAEIAQSLIILPLAEFRSYPTQIMSIAFWHIIETCLNLPATQTMNSVIEKNFWRTQWPSLLPSILCQFGSLAKWRRLLKILFIGQVGLNITLEMASGGPRVLFVKLAFVVKRKLLVCNAYCSPAWQTALSKS